MISDWQGRVGSNTVSVPAPASLEPSAPPCAIPLATPEQDPSISVHDWLVSVNPALSVYAAPLREYGYDNVGLLQLSDEDDASRRHCEC
jgi:hypothetical protein